MDSKGKQLKSILINHYYSNIYQKFLFANSSQSKGIEYFENFVEKCGRRKKKDLEYGKVLEIGSGQGEHWKFLKDLPTQEYVAVDLRDMTDHSYLNNMSAEFKQIFKFVRADAENLPFTNDYFDKVFSTCLLHHVDHPLDVLMEARRVVKVGGDLLFVMPTDPGLANQLVKYLFSYRTLKKLTDYDPRLVYALEHKNHIRGLITLINFVFKDDDLKFKFTPIGLRSWNLNLIVGVKIKKSRVEPNYIYPEVHGK